ncbi:hypothetical protein DEA8626_01618 [Defluviimonas aquaemixtae]|uniref:Glycosyltransferase RgtA/B/C/D-like domain-containing protein n=2 Tax=Albidovulum aquaemixtae TaxID=1542388 RepID=A0A2R8B628_9RHOB|nr:hypothetical protein DEA8626_01618 [Defluviimonas aquaemixtae]
MERLIGPIAALAAVLALLGAYWAPMLLPASGEGPVIAPADRWMLCVLAFALGVLAHSIRREAAMFGVLAFIFLLGGAAQLYMTEPLWFPSLRLRPTNGREWLMAAIMGVEAVTALWALRKLEMPALWSEAAERLGARRIGVFLALTFAFAVPILSYIARGALAAYLAHVAAGAVLILVHFALLLAMSQVKSPVTGLRRVAPIMPALFAVGAGLALAQFSFERLPHVEDEVAYLIQAKTFAGGALTLPAPPEAAQPGLDYYLLEISDGRWYSTSLPGWPALLAVGLMLGVPWLINPLLAGISVLLAYDITRRKAGRDEADFVALMMASSPWILAAAASLMPHMLTLTLLLAAWWLILRAPVGSAKSGRRLFGAGLAMGWIFATRPLDGLVVGGLTGLWLLMGAGSGGRISRITPYAAGAVAAGALLLVHNWHLTGSPLTLPLSAYLDRHWAPGANAYGFGPDIGPPGGWVWLDLWAGHSPLEALLNTFNLVVSLQLELLGWSVGSLALLYAYFLWQRERLVFDAAMVVVIVAIVFALSLYWFADSYYFGPRYWFLAAFPLLYLSARGYGALRRIFPGTNESGIVRIDTILGLCCLFGLFVFTPWRGVMKFNEYENFHSTYRTELAAGTFGNAVVIIDEPGDEGSAFILNDPWLTDPDRPIFLNDTGTLDEDALRAAFPGREIMRFRPDWDLPEDR